MSAIPLAEAVGRVRAALAEGRLEDAQRWARAVRRAAPESVTAQRVWAAVLLRQGETAAAEDALGRVLAIDPEDAEAWVLLAEARRARGDREGARALVQVGWECEPSRREWAERLAEWLGEEDAGGQLFPSSACLSAWYMLQGWWARASEECRATLGRLGERWDIRQRLCVALWWQGAHREAEVEAEQLLRARGEVVGALLVLALSARERGDEPTARRYRDRLWELDPLATVVDRFVPVERWDERAWLTVPETSVVEEYELVEAVGETDLVWELPSEEELEAARPSPRDVGEVVVAREEEAFGPLREGAREADWPPSPGAEGLGAVIDSRGVLEAGWTGFEPLVEEVTGVAGMATAASAEEEPSAGAATVAGDEAAEEGIAVEREGARPAAVGVGEELGGPSEAIAFGRGRSGETGEEQGVPGDEPARVRALLESGAVREAMRLAQVLVSRGEGGDELVPVLERVVESGGPGARQAAMTLGAIYRRRGEAGMAARYYELALRLRNE
ncbi:MAG: tetratricopeptide repeat protein [Thermomicrobium sp.]|nr:tetratricopeptide repeat protein [Thermomicrobium sp.]MDW7981630.1 tetratricopeptide repeat protein [Thermomicrobium sp.]